jgi:AcrR family transcriptional regulator
VAKTSVKRAASRSRIDAEQLSEQILDAFSARAKRIGLRALHMGELATELRMSATTLYKLYPSKEALASACLERWADELGAAEAAKQDSKRQPFEQYMHWIDAWADANASISPAFLRDLQTDYPAVWKRYGEVLGKRKRHGMSLLRPLLHPDVDERVAFALLNRIFGLVQDPEFAAHINVSRRDALRGAVAIWAGGALVRTGGKARTAPRALKVVKAGKAVKSRVR